MLQETHALVTDYEFWKQQWGQDIWMSYGSDNSAGVAIPKGKFKGKVLKNKIHVFGRWIVLAVKFMDTIFVLSNIYGTNNSSRNQALFEEVEEEICSFLRLFPSVKLILEGDWNSI